MLWFLWLILERERMERNEMLPHLSGKIEDSLGKNLESLSIPIIHLKFTRKSRLLSN